MGRSYKLLSPADITTLWSRWQQGQTPVEISAALGCHQWTVGWHIERRGGLPPRERRRARQALTLAEREEISRGIVAGRPRAHDCSTPGAPTIDGEP